VDLNESVRGVVKLFEPQLCAVGRPPITPELYLDEKTRISRIPRPIRFFCAGRLKISSSILSMPCLPAGL